MQWAAVNGPIRLHSRAAYSCSHQHVDNVNSTRTLPAQRCAPAVLSEAVIVLLLSVRLSVCKSARKRKSTHRKSV